MALHTYTKERYSAKRQLAHIFSYISLTLGSILLFWSFYPIVSFWIYSKLFIEQGILSPIPRSKLVGSLQKADSVVGSYNVYSSNLRDFVQASLWFPKTHQTEPPAKLNVKEFTISIPKINITNALVKVGGDDLSKSLIHYLPTSLPGEAGNVAIFGHSTLPTLYDEKNYRTIFTYLPSVEKGDKVYVKVADNTYEYEIYDIFIVDPDEISVLNQQYDAAYLTLVTCTPPGTVQDRLIVKAKMKGLPTNAH